VGATDLPAVDEPLDELDALVGLGSVKEEIRRRVAVHRLNLERERAGEPVLAEELDLVFGGDPGTGEAEVARLVGALYAGLGLLPSGHVREVTRADLIGPSEETTVARTQAAVAEAAGGILFVDEAHLLVVLGPDDPGSTALAALVTLMQARPTPFAVILSGPTQPMRLIVERHPILRDLVDRVIEFPRYTPEELLAILRLQVGDLRLDLPDDVAAAALVHLDAVHRSGTFRSARYIPALVDEMYGRLAQRAAAGGDTPPRAFTVEDVPGVEEAHLEDRGLRIGFSAPRS
jgi:hypothetical protein